MAVRAAIRQAAFMRAGLGGHAREPRPNAARAQRTGAARCSLGASTHVHVHVCSVLLVIMRHCSYLDNNLIKELPAKIFDKNVKLTWLCVDSHRACRAREHA